MIVFSLLLLLLREVAASLHPTISPLQSNTRICGKVRSFAGETGSIQSPGYPYRYPSNTYCSYDITVNLGFRIELTWKDFDIDGDMPHCNSKNGDYVEAFTGCGKRRRFLSRFCSRNSVTPHALYSVDNCMSLHLFTRPEELAKDSKGFLAEYKAVNMSEVLIYQKCNVTFAESSGVIHSTFWPWTYRYKELDNCNWHLKVDQTMVIQFTFMDVRTHDEYGSHDAVVVQGIGSLFISKQSWEEFYGWHFPFLYRTWYNELVINWRKNSMPYYRDSLAGFITGYVAYRPVDHDMAGWQYGLLAGAAFLAMYTSLIFSCRHSLRQQSAIRRHYRRLVSTNSIPEDMEVADGPAGNQNINECDVQRVEQHAENDIECCQHPAGNNIQVNHTQNVSNIPNNTNTDEPGTMRMRDIPSNGSDTHNHEVLPPSNFRVEALFHPVPPSVQEQPTFENHEVEDTCLSEVDEQLLLHQPDTMYPMSATLPSTSKFPNSAPTTLISPASAPSIQTLSIPPASSPSIQTLSRSLPQTSTNEQGGLQQESRFPIHATAIDDVVSQSGPTNNLGFADDSALETDPNLSKPESALLPDSGVVSEAIAPSAPPPYDQIYQELQSLSQIVAGIISDIE